MDGLLIDSERGMWMKSERKAFTSLGYTTTDDFLRSMMGLSGDDLRQIFIKAYGKDFPYDKYMTEVYRLNEEVIEKGSIDLMPGAKELLDYLKDKNIKCVVGTGTPKEKAIKILTKTGLIDYFEEVYSGYDVPHGKPFPDIYLKCLGNTPNDEAIVFEDSLNGEKSAIAAGIEVIIVPDLCYFSLEDRNKAYKVLNNLNEAIKIIDNILK